MAPISDSILIFTIISMVILIAPLVAKKIRIPDIVLLMIAGTALGENGFGFLQRNSAITLFGEVGLVYIMFLSGLEIDLFQFKRTRKRSINFGLLTFLIPQIIGTVGVVYFLGESWPAALLMASMFASHTLLAYPVASRLGIHKSEVVTVTVGATIVTNVLALLVLAVVVETAGGAEMDLKFWAGIGLGMTGLIALTWWGIPKLAKWFFKNFTESGGSQFMFVLGVTCACSYFSFYARMEPIIGAFLAGASFNRLIPERSPLMNRLVFAGNTLFIPFFLISVGMLVDPSALVGDLRTWKVIGVMVGLVVLTKWIAAWIGAKWFRYSGEERNVMFGLSVVQAAATLAAVLVGMREGVAILDSAALNGAIAMILATVILGAWVVEKSGRKMALKSLSTSVANNAEQRILLSVANPFSATRLMDLGLLLRDPDRRGALYPLTIVSESNQSDEAVAHGEQLLVQCLAHGESADENVIPSVRVDLNPADGIVRAVRDLRASMVLTGWGGEHTPSARIFGSVSRNLSERCPARLMLCRITRPLNTHHRILIPFPPLSEHRSDLPALCHDAKRLCKQLSAELVVFLSGDNVESLKAQLEAAQPACDYSCHETDTWKEARARLFDEVREEDLILLPQERKNSVLWTPTLDRMPDLIDARFPKSNFIVAYPPLPQSGDEQLPGSVDPAPPDHKQLGEFRGIELPGNIDPSSTLLHLTRMGLQDDPTLAGEAHRQLLDSAKHHPVDLHRDIVLLHAHSGSRPAPLVLVGHGRIQHPFFSRNTPPKVVLALLSPRGNGPKTHLKALAALAGRFRDPEVLEAVLNAENADEICEILSRSSQS